MKLTRYEAKTAKRTFHSWNDFHRYFRSVWESCLEGSF